MGYFAVIDTETNWSDQVMSIGTVIADRDSFQAVDARYHVLTPEYEIGGMFSATLFADPRLQPEICRRAEAIRELTALFRQYGITELLAYNAGFDKKHLPELGAFRWCDIMRLAAYRQFNRRITARDDCCQTGRLRRGYGVEDMLRRLAGDRGYCETHNALLDAMDELQIMRLLGHKLDVYIPL